MRIGPKEREILLRLIPGEFVPPSVYLGDYVSCAVSPPSKYTIHRLKEKGLVITRSDTWGPDDFLRQMKLTRPGRETFEVNAALKLTVDGVEIRDQLLMRAAT